ncbi:hypothetical protein COCNU_11G009850 [Cocos nucifera]|uniref:Uncharacterized protein n=1 Tax=Cocos nucifera TaxID=13894 RepID=A0A8K0IQB1_COCNU|nr:hypothetical protein COCNU_11G009850 [Cocos nucifera]
MRSGFGLLHSVWPQEETLVFPASHAKDIVGLKPRKTWGSDEETQIETSKNTDKAQYMAMKLQENAQHIHAMLRGELEDDASQVRAPVDLTKPYAMETDFTG